MFTKRHFRWISTVLPIFMVNSKALRQNPIYCMLEKIRQHQPGVIRWQIRIHKLSVFSILAFRA